MSQARVAEMRVSPYNIIVEKVFGDTGVIYNGVTGTILRIQPRVREAIRSGRIELLTPGERADFESKGILTRCIETQKDSLRKLYEHMKSPWPQCTFVISPTSKCNLACPYCYERSTDDDAGLMSREIAGRTVKFICNNMDDPERHTAALKFYGGEPLLALDTCRQIASDVAGWMQAHSKKISFWIQTNGTLIDEKTFCPPFPERTYLEATVDGPKKKHDRTRTNDRKDPTYERVIRGIHTAAEHGVRIILRVNAHSGREMAEALDDLDEHGVKAIEELSFYDGQVSGAFSKWIKGTGCQGKIESAEHMETVVGIRRVIAEKGWTDKYQSFPFFRAERGLCHFARPGNYSIDAAGNLYLCSFQMGDENYRVGVIEEDGTASFSESYFEIMRRSPFDHEKCSECAYLPQCWGGCFAKAFGKHGSFSAPECDGIQDTLGLLMRTALVEGAYA
ncbi:MAG: SPASM domain-containing protein [Phycisphaerales bacterium]|nr:MAG: SPASM domain-containing protein [Phycisphaerales bacterium]